MLAGQSNAVQAEIGPPDGEDVASDATDDDSHEEESDEDESDGETDAQMAQHLSQLEALLSGPNANTNAEVAAQALQNAVGPEGLHQLFRALHLQRSRRQQAGSHADLMESLIAQGHLQKDKVRTAFNEVDRKAFCGGNDDDDDSAYYDRPYRETMPCGLIIHLSAPSIYAVAADALDLSRGLSFLNVGSGTGYFSAIIARLIGPHAPHHGVEIREGLVELSRRLTSAGSSSPSSSPSSSSASCPPPPPCMQFHHGSIEDVDVRASMQFDRIYVGAGATLAGAGKKVLALLRVGGVCAHAQPSSPPASPFPSPCSVSVLLLRLLLLLLLLLLEKGSPPLSEPPPPPALDLPMHRRGRRAV